jgi:hypothetical protein
VCYQHCTVTKLNVPDDTKLISCCWWPFVQNVLRTISRYQTKTHRTSPYAVPNVEILHPFDPSVVSCLLSLISGAFCQALGLYVPAVVVLWCVLWIASDSVPSYRLICGVPAPVMGLGAVLHVLLVLRIPFYLSGMDDSGLGIGSKRVERRGYEDYDADVIKKTRGSDGQALQLALVPYTGVF